MKQLINGHNLLGEGVFWSALHQRVFWFDILNQHLFSCTEEGEDLLTYTLPFMASYGYPLDQQTLLLVTEHGLFHFNLITQAATLYCPVEADNAMTRSNDATYDTQGNLWFSTMGRSAEKDAGSVYRLPKGMDTPIQCIERLTIPNSLAMDCQHGLLYMTDSPTRQIYTYRVTDSGQLTDRTLFRSLENGVPVPDGSCLDSNGDLYNAQWGGSAVVKYKGGYDPSQSGTVLATFPLPVTQVTCCAIGGKEGNKLFITTAREQLTPEELMQQPAAGGLFVTSI